MNNKNYYSFCLSVMLLLCFNEVFAQKGLIRGLMEDSSTKKPLVFGTISVYKASDSSIVSFRMSDEKGIFRIANLPLNIPYRIIISLSGYQIVRRYQTLSDQLTDLNLGTIRMIPDSKTLEEVLVYAERPPVVVRNDTIEFNAASFKTLPNALVEDLLKKLPGVTVDNNGNIRVNGITVTKILVESKIFFGGDFRIASRNLPADIIDKVQVLDDPDQREDNVFVKPGQLDKVINLTLKKGIKKGMFGKLYAGAGTDKRYEGGGILNLFRDTSQVSLIGFSNNINRAGFTIGEVGTIGGFNRSGSSSTMRTASGGFSLDGISFGNTSEGIQQSTGIGLNTNTLLGKRAELNFRYFYGGVTSEFSELRERRQFLKDTILTSEAFTNRSSTDRSHHLGTNLKWKFNRFTTLTIKPSVQLTKITSNGSIKSSTIHNFKGNLNNSDNIQQVNGTSYSALNTASLDMTSRKIGRKFVFSTDFKLSNNKNDQYNQVDNEFSSGQPSADRIDQLRLRATPGVAFGISGTYQEPLSKSTGLKFSNKFTYGKSSEEIETLGKGVNQKEYDVVIDSLSNDLKRQVNRNITSVGFTWRKKSLSIAPIVDFQFLQLRNSFDKFPSTRQQYTYLLPGIDIGYNSFLIHYGAFVTEPPLAALQPIINNTNPLYLQIGNPSLTPSITHSVYFNFYRNIAARNLSYNLMFSPFIVKNAISYERSVNADGVQFSKPINISGNARFRAGGSVNKQVKTGQELSISIESSMYVLYNNDVIVVNQEKARQSNWNITPQIGYSFNLRDMLEINQQYTVTIAEGTAGNAYFQNIGNVSHYLRSDVILRSVKNLVFESSLDFYANPQVDAGIPKNMVIWNAAINHLFLKNKRANIKFAAYDLFNQNKDVSRTVSENYISTVRRTTLQRFFLLTLTYNVRDFNPGKTGGRNKLLLF